MYKIIFPDWYDERAELETPAKGHLDNAIIQLEDGKRFRLSFVDEYNLRTGWTEPNQRGVVVLDEVSSQAVIAVAPTLIRENYLDTLEPEMG